MVGMTGFEPADPLIPNQVHYQAVLHPDTFRKNKWRAQQESNPQPFDP